MGWSGLFASGKLCYVQQEGSDDDSCSHPVERILLTIIYEQVIIIRGLFFPAIHCMTRTEQFVDFMASD